MSADIREDVYRIKLSAPLKKTLLATLRDPDARVRRPRPQPVRNADGRYSVVVFVPASFRAKLSARSEVQIVESANITARLRQGPLSAVDAGLETVGYSAGPMIAKGKAAPLSAV